MTDQQNTDNSFTVPSDPEVRKRIRQAVAEASAQLQMISDRKEALKEIAKMAKDELEVPKRTFNKMVKAFHKQEYAAIVHDNEVFQTFYESIMEDASQT